MFPLQRKYIGLVVLALVIEHDRQVVHARQCLRVLLSKHRLITANEGFINSQYPRPKHPQCLLRFHYGHPAHP
jgi:hypothetical protein